MSEASIDQNPILRDPGLLQEAIAPTLLDTRLLSLRQVCWLRPEIGTFPPRHQPRETQPKERPWSLLGLGLQQVGVSCRSPDIFSGGEQSSYLVHMDIQCL